MAQKKVLVLGGRGMLGTVLCRSLRADPDLKILTHSQSSTADFTGDLADFHEVIKLLRTSEADFCINTVALTDVNEAEADRDKARRLNVTPMRNLVKAIMERGFDTQLIHISTDHMYDKNLSAESDVRIINQYALTKYVADEISQVIDAVVLRTNFFGASASAKKSFSDWIIESLQQGCSLKGYEDVFFSPLHIETLCAEIARVIKNFTPGIYNLGSHDGMSKYQFMLNLAQHRDLPKSLIAALPYSQAQDVVPRPRDMRMDVSKYEKTFRVRLPNLREEIIKC